MQQLGNGKQLDERLVEKLMEMAQKRFEKDPDLTLRISNNDYNKSLNVDLPYLFKPSTLCSSAP